MNELIKINYENSDRPTVMGRELHKALEVKTAYKDWFPRMLQRVKILTRSKMSRFAQKAKGRLPEKLPTTSLQYQWQRKSA